MMTCPKCQNQMQSFTRSGLTVEQCLGCRGVFLDYGELERIIQAEGQYWAQQMQQQPMAPPPPNPLAPRPPGSHGVVMHTSHHHPHHRGHYRRKSFLGELLDM